MNDIQRTPALQAVIDAMEKEFGITDEFQESSNHPYSCRCDKCLNWWRIMGPDEDDNGDPFYGPFTKEEVEGE